MSAREQKCLSNLQQAYDSIMGAFLILLFPYLHAVNRKTLPRPSDKEQTPPQ